MRHALVQILHQDVQSLRTVLRGVDTGKDGRHLGRFYGGENFGEGGQVDFLTYHQLEFLSPLLYNDTHCFYELA